MAVASVLAMRPRVVVMDEPSANLDEVATARLRTIVETLLHRGVTVVVSGASGSLSGRPCRRGAAAARAGRVERRFAAENWRVLRPRHRTSWACARRALDEVRAVPRRGGPGPAVLEVRDGRLPAIGARRRAEGTSFSVREGEGSGIVRTQRRGQKHADRPRVRSQDGGVGTVSIGGVVAAEGSACGQATYCSRIRIASCSRKASKPSCFWASVPTRRARARGAQLARMGLAGLEDRQTQHRLQEAEAVVAPSRWLMEGMRVLCLGRARAALDYRRRLMMGVGSCCGTLAEGRGIVVITHDYEVAGVRIDCAAMARAGRRSGGRFGRSSDAS